jgi:hypothetical protein
MKTQKSLRHRRFSLLKAQILLVTLDVGELAKLLKDQEMSASTKATKAEQCEWSGSAL